MSMDAPPPPPPPVMGGTGSAPTAALGNPLIGYWKQVVLERYAQFTGRARRAEFWWYALANFIISVVFNVVGGAITPLFSVIGFIYSLAVLIPGIAVGIRRLHDTDRSGWWWLIALIPLVGIIVLIVFFATDSKPGTNQYGTSEKYPVG